MPWRERMKTIKELDIEGTDLNYSLHVILGYLSTLDSGEVNVTQLAEYSQHLVDKHKEEAEKGKKKVTYYKYFYRYKNENSLMESRFNSDRWAKILDTLPYPENFTLIKTEEREFEI